MFSVKKKTITEVFQKIVTELVCKPNELWVDKHVNFIINQ